MNLEINDFMTNLFVITTKSMVDFLNEDECVYLEGAQILIPSLIAEVVDISKNSSISSENCLIIYKKIKFLREFSEAISSAAFLPLIAALKLEFNVELENHPHYLYFSIKNENKNEQKLK